MRRAEHGLGISEKEFAWGVLLLQEFTDACFCPSDIAGHLVICSPSIGGQRRRPARGRMKLRILVNIRVSLLALQFLKPGDL